MPRNTSVTLGEHFDSFVTQKIASGRFQSVSEAVRAGLRKLEEDEAKLDVLRAKLEAGEHSSAIHDFSTDAFIERMHEKHNP